eukprot:TRINITY_DN37378_c0_g1_i1.p1 TRINITY_DN37378_c0_g1~~TRINITY_DN37378_c0_g1_i1.p1  ORF type:complete len:701 (+),score=165.34 TRINITY_DN37378_c0_g1_i1:49-2151(+)
MEELSGGGLLEKLFWETTEKANNVIFLHPQLALCGLVHSVDEKEMMFGYSHVPSMRNLILLAAHAFGRAGRSQAVVMMGDWTPTLVQSLVASIHDALSEGVPLRWSHPREVTRLQSTLHLLLLFTTLSGKYSMAGLSILLATGHSGAVDVSVSTIWLYPGFLTTLKKHNEMGFIFNIPIFQHLMAAPRQLLEAFLPATFLANYGSLEDKGKWFEFVDMFSGLGFTDLQIVLEGVLQAVSLTLLLLDTTFEQGNQRMLSNITAMCELLDCSMPALIQGLKPSLDSKGVVGNGLPEAVYLHVVDWVCGCSGGELKRFKLPQWPFTVDDLGPRARRDGRSGVSVVVMPQASPSFGPKGSIPDCLASCVLLANIAAEHLNVWAAKTLLPETQKATCCALIHEFMTPTSKDNPKTYLETCLSAGAVPRTSRSLVKPMPTYLSVAHTHKTVNYPVLPLEKGSTEKFLFGLAEFLAPLLAADALFTHQVPVYISSNAGVPRLFPALEKVSEESIENSVFLSAARQLFVSTVGKTATKKGQRKEEVCAQITELQKELEKLDIIEEREPKETVRHHSTPESKKTRRKSVLIAESPVSPAPTSSSPSPKKGNPLEGSLSQMVHLTKSFRLRKERSHTPASPPPQPQPLPHPQPQTTRSKKPSVRPPLTTLKSHNQEARSPYSATPQPSPQPASFTRSNWKHMLANMVENQ